MFIRLTLRDGKVRNTRLVNMDHIVAVTRSVIYEGGSTLWLEANKTLMDVDESLERIHELVNQKERR